MNKQRVKSISILVAIFVAGLLVGLMIPAAMHNMRNGQHGRMDDRRGGDERGKDWFAHRLKQVVEANDAQAQQIDTIASWANERLNAIERKTNEQSIQVLDSAVNQIKPLLNAEQQKKIEDFRAHASERAKGRGRRRN